MPRFTEWSGPVWARQVGQAVFCKLGDGVEFAYTYSDATSIPSITLWDWQANPANKAFYEQALQAPNLMQYLDPKAGMELWLTHHNPAIVDGQHYAPVVLASLQHMVAYAWQCYGVTAWHYNSSKNWWYCSLPIPFAPECWLVSKGVILP